MEKYIEEIIEIILDNVSCEHPYVVEHGTEGIAIAQVEYSLMNEKEVIKKCLAAIPAYPMKFILKVDNKFIEEEAKILSGMSLYSCKGVSLRGSIGIGRASVFIRKLISKLSEKINLKGD